MSRGTTRNIVFFFFSCFVFVSFRWPRARYVVFATETPSARDALIGVREPREVRVPPGGGVHGVPLVARTVSRPRPPSSQFRGRTVTHRYHGSTWRARERATDRPRGDGDDVRPRWWTAPSSLAPSDEDFNGLPAGSGTGTGTGTVGDRRVATWPRGVVSILSRVIIWCSPYACLYFRVERASGNV